MKIRVSNKLNNLAKLFGRETPIYIVGGYVRDCLLGVYNTDIDLSGALTPDEVAFRLEGTPYRITVKDKTLGAIKIECGRECYEYTTFRVEEYDKDGGHYPSNVHFTTSIVEDARRRDFTVNAIYYNILTREIIDLYKGEHDIREKCIKCIETPEYVFKDDGLRILRMIRLSAELGFTIDQDTLYVAAQQVHKLESISRERMSSEFIKIIYASHKYCMKHNNDRGVQGVKLFDKLGLWKYINKNDDYLMILSGVGSFLKCYKYASKVNALLSFVVDAYMYINNFGDKVQPKEFIKTIFGPRGINIDKDIVNSLSEDLDLVMYITDRQLSDRDFTLCVAYRYADLTRLSEVIGSVLPGINKRIYLEHRRLIKIKAPLQTDALKISIDDIVGELGCEESHGAVLHKELQDLCVLEPRLNNSNALMQEVRSHKDRGE